MQAQVTRELTVAAIRQASKLTTSLRPLSSGLGSYATSSSSAPPASVSFGGDATIVPWEVLQGAQAVCEADPVARGGPSGESIARPPSLAQQRRSASRPSPAMCVSHRWSTMSGSTAISMRRSRCARDRHAGERAQVRAVNSLIPGVFRIYCDPSAMAFQVRAHRRQRGSASASCNVMNIDEGPRPPQASPPPRMGSAEKERTKKETLQAAAAHRLARAT